MAKTERAAMITINLLGYQYQQQPDFRITRPNGSGDFLTLLLHEPTKIIFSSGTEVITEQPSVLIYNQSTPQHYEACNNRYVDDWFHFKLEGNLNYFNELGLSLDTVYPINNSHSVQNLSQLIQNMTHIFFNQLPNKKLLLNQYADLFFSELALDLKKEKKAFHQHPFFNSFESLRMTIQNEPYQQWSVEELAARLSVSYDYFLHLYKQFFNVSCMDDIINQRIRYAKYHLERTNLTVTEISKLSGYTNDIHFMRQFKKRTGLTPTQYRKKMQK